MNPPPINLQCENYDQVLKRADKNHVYLKCGLLFNSLLYQNIMMIKKAIKDDWDLLGVVDGREGCLSGDTIINCNRATLGRKYTIKHLFNQYANNSVRKPFDLSIPTFVRSFNGDEIKLNKIVGVYYSGKKQTYELKTKNNTIRATSTHKFLTREGWKPLSELSVGTEIMLDSLNAKSKNRKKPKLYDIQIGQLKYHPRAQSGGKRLKRIEVHRLIYEARLNNLDFRIYLEHLINDEKISKSFKFIEDGYHVHHKDGNHYNNSIENLELLTAQEHLKVHSEDNYKNFNQGVPIFSRVESIIEYGTEDTYDIECEAPHHNFVANGIVVHNSGKSVIAQQLAFLCDQGFNIDRIAFTPDRFIELIKTLPKYSAVVYDESRRGLNSRRSMSEVNVTITNILAEVRQKNLYVFIVLPSIFDLDKSVATFRARFLVHVYADVEKDESVGEGDELSPYEIRRGYFKFYGEDRLTRLFMAGKKFYDYSASDDDFAGRFLGDYVVDEADYRRLKLEALSVVESVIDSVTISTSARMLLTKTIFVKILKLGRLPMHMQDLYNVLGITQTTARLWRIEFDQEYVAKGLPTPGELREGFYFPIKKTKGLYVTAKMLEEKRAKRDAKLD